MSELRKISENGIPDEEFEAAKAISLRSLETGAQLDSTWISLARGTLAGFGYALNPLGWKTMIDHVRKEEVEHLLRAIAGKHTTRTVIHFGVPENKKDIKPDLEQIRQTEEANPC